MSEKFSYYTGYEQDDESSIEEFDAANDSKSEDEFENEFSQYLKSLKKSEIKQKPKKKEITKNFEDEMNAELDNFIELQEKKYNDELKNLSTQPKKTPSEESDTDSEAEMETGVRTTKKREHFTNDELFYDPDADDADEEWINQKRKTCKKIPSPSKKPAKSILRPSTSEDSKKEESIETKYTNARTDAILNCPCCMTLLCMDCQRHEKFKTQFRAMFVFNCNVKKDEQLKYPKENKEKRKKKESNDVEMSESQQEFDLYKPVECSSCKTEVGVFDPKDEMYHLFNVLVSHS